MEKEMQQELQGMLGLEPTRSYTLQELKELLAKHVNNLLQTNFEQLVNLLYRIDVSEKNLKALLAQNPKQDAGDIIAVLIIERQLQKIKSRQQFKTDADFEGEEKW